MWGILLVHTEVPPHGPSRCYPLRTRWPPELWQALAPRRRSGIASVGAASPPPPSERSIVPKTAPSFSPMFPGREGRPVHAPFTTGSAQWKAPFLNDPFQTIFTTPQYFYTKLPRRRERSWSPSLPRPRPFLVPILLVPTPLVLLVRVLVLVPPSAVGPPPTSKF